MEPNRNQKAILALLGNSNYRQPVYMGPTRQDIVRAMPDNEIIDLVTSGWATQLEVDEAKKRNLI